MTALDLTHEFLSQPEAKWWLAWLSVPSIGQRTFSKLQQFCRQQQVTLKEVWDSVFLQEKGVLSPNQISNLNIFKKDFQIDLYIEKIIQNKIWLVSTKSKYYPKHLREISRPPWLLFGQGNIPSWQDHLLIAVVGSRHPSEYGIKATHQLVPELVLAGVTIVSGFMYGIDTTAHEVALKNGGTTIGVLGFGCDHISPSTHRQLYQDYLAQGMSFITEFAPHIVAHKYHFPMRNRIVAGISQAVLVVEATQQSGSLITAHLAAEYGRAVGAVPGPITHLSCEGTKALINEGAKLVSTARDLFEEIGGELTPTYSSDMLGTQNFTANTTIWQQLPTEQRLIAQFLSQKQTSTSNEVAQKLNLPIKSITVTLSLMELAGIIEQREDVWRLTR